ncbi:hypothetical protein QBC34DRAFT_459314 [Podospora aff. communis PSN243]|uniref:Uncharacterized protein n=1 Tax=Podospora aff. communis PSN243 TaxID=3040156 RepID=A0AAV9GSI9_9PEZI|nr:hypothetical protein QBC34DRAFT_459314 [Podospora aff. communis PSN243]
MAMPPIIATPKNRGSKRRRTIVNSDDEDQVPQFVEPQPPPSLAALPPPAAPRTPIRRVPTAAYSPRYEPDSSSPTIQPYLSVVNQASPNRPFVLGFDPTVNDPFTNQPRSGTGTLTAGANGEPVYRIPQADVRIRDGCRQRGALNSRSPTRPSRGPRIETRSRTRANELRRERARIFSAGMARRRELEGERVVVAGVEDMERMSLDEEEDPEEAATIILGTPVDGHDVEDMKLDSEWSEENKENSAQDNKVSGTPHANHAELDDGDTIVACVGRVNAEIPS